MTGPPYCHQVKNAGRKLGRRCDMCSNYEKQLQVIQGQEADTRDQVQVFSVHVFVHLNISMLSQPHQSEVK